MNSKLVHILEKVLGPGKSTARDNYAFVCPFCSTSKTKLEVNLVTTSDGSNPWHCWVCNKAGKKIITLLRLLKVSREILSETASLIGQQKPSSSSVKKHQQTSIQLPKEYHPLHIPVNSFEYKNALHYILKERKLTLSEIVKYGIGYCENGEYSNKLIFPSYDANGNLNYFVARSYYKDSPIKYINTSASKDCVGYELFVNWRLPIVLVEGVFDAIAVRRNAIPLFGKTISSDLKRKIILNEVKKVYICLDKDAIKEAIRHAEDFLKKGIRVYFVDLDKKDPSEIGFKQMSLLLKKTPEFTFEDLIKMKLQYGRSK